MDRGYDTRSPIQKKSSVPRTVAFFRLYLISLTIFTALGIFLVIAYTPLFRIQEVVVTGAESFQNESIQAYTVKLLEGNWRTIIPMHSVVSVPTQSIEKSIAETFPFIHGVSVFRRNMSSVEVVIRPRVSAYTFCEGNDCVVIDDNGVIFDVLERSEEKQIIEGDISDFVKRSLVGESQEIVFGAYILPQGPLASLRKATSFLKAERFEVKKIELLPLGFFDIVTVEPISQKQLVFRLRDSSRLDQNLEELKLAFGRGLLEKIQTTPIEYVISYVPQKVIYKTSKE